MAQTFPDLRVRVGSPHVLKIVCLGCTRWPDWRSGYAPEWNDTPPSPLQQLPALAWKPGCTPRPKALKYGRNPCNRKHCEPLTNRIYIYIHMRVFRCRSVVDLSCTTKSFLAVEFKHYIYIWCSCLLVLHGAHTCARSYVSNGQGSFHNSL